MSRYLLRTNQKGDEKGIEDLFKKSFGKERGEDEWNWRYNQNPAGKSLVKVAIDDDKIMGHYAVSPAIYKVKEKEQIGMQEIDLMVSPEYTKGLKKAGVFVKLGKALYDAVRESGIKFTFGFPNQNSAPIGSKMLGWKKVEEIPLYSFYLGKNLIYEKMNGNSIKKYVAIILFKIYFLCCKLIRTLILRKNKSIEKLEKFHENDDLLWENNNSNYEIAVKRNYRYLNWRFFSKPSKDYVVYGIHKGESLSGYIALKVISSESGNYREGLIVDLFTEWDNSSLAKLLIVKAIKYFENMKCDVVRSWMMPDFFYNSAYIQLGFKKAPSKISLYINTMGEDPINDVLKNSRWFVQMADTDGV